MCSRCELAELEAQGGTRLGKGCKPLQNLAHAALALVCTISMRRESLDNCMRVYLQASPHACKQNIKRYMHACMRKRMCAHVPGRHPPSLHEHIPMRCSCPAPCVQPTRAFTCVPCATSVPVATFVKLTTAVPICLPICARQRTPEGKKQKQETSVSLPLRQLRQEHPERHLLHTALYCIILRQASCASLDPSLHSPCPNHAQCSQPEPCTSQPPVAHLDHSGLNLYHLKRAAAMGHAIV